MLGAATSLQTGSWLITGMWLASVYIACLGSLEYGVAADIIQGHDELVNTLCTSTP